jgi:hypothetical protein
MSTFRACLQAEILKGKRSFATWLSLFGTGANVLLFSLFYLYGPTQGTPIAQHNPWEPFVLLFFNGIAFMMLPLYVIILTSLINFQEHRSGSWNNLFALPVSRWQLYSSKQLYTLLHFIAAHLLFIAGMLLSGALIGLFRPQSGLLDAWPPPGLIAALAGQTILAILGLLAFHHWISWRFRHFIIPLTIGILGFVLSALLSPMWEGSPFFWYSIPLFYMPVVNDILEVPIYAGVGLHLWMSLFYFLLFTGIGYWNVGRRTV